MRKFLFLLIISLCFSLAAKAQDTEKDAVKRVVETYLFSENDDEREQTVYEQARIFSTEYKSDKIEDKRFISAKRKKGVKVVSVQKVVDIEIAEEAAIVKVVTDLSSGNIKVPKHFQFISLLKSNGAWKIVSILMPKVRLAQ